MKLISAIISLLAATALTGCGPSFQTAHQADPSLQTNTYGKRIGLAASYRKSASESSMNALTRMNESSTRTIAKQFFTNPSLGAVLNGKIIEVDEENVLGKDRPLVLYYNAIAENPSFKVAINPEAVKAELAKNEVDCLLLFSTGQVSESETKVNWTKFAEFGLRMATAATGGMATTAGGGDFTSGSMKQQGMMLYTCGDKVLYLGGASGDATAQPWRKTQELFMDTVNGKQK